MPQSRYFNFDDPHDFQATINGATCEVLLSKGSLRAELTRIELKRLWLQQITGDTSFMVHSSNDKARFPILFLANARGAPVRHNGRELSPEEIVVFQPGATNHTRFEGPGNVATMSLTPADILTALQAKTGREPTAPRDTHRIRPAPALMARLRELHNAASGLGQSAAPMLANPAIATALENDLVDAMVACLAGPHPIEPKSHASQRQRVMSRFEMFMAERHHEPVYVSEICAAIGVSESALRSFCREQLGMGPTHYLWLQRMHLACHALTNPDMGTKTVTNVATDYGFWELGRFSVQYRELFGESPSATLKRWQTSSTRP